MHLIPLPAINSSTAYGGFVPPCALNHNRLLEMIYPDEEKITYSYNLGGLLEKVRGYKSYGYDYVNKLGYDKFEQRSYLKYCNGAETFYTYDPARRRLSNLAVYLPLSRGGGGGARAIMDNAYTYDAVSNVLSVANSAPLPANGAGGNMKHTYTYDNLYRLATASGTYTGAEQKTAGYNLTMSYDNMHRITAKKQHITQKNVQFDGALNAGYDLAYTYSNEAGKKFQLANVNDLNYRTEETPNKKTENNHAYSYDKNGNLVYVNTSQTKLDGTNEPKVNERKLRWDEENRLLAVDDNGFVSQYWYDADGERTVKTSGDGEAVYVNSLFSGGNTATQKFTLYVSPYLVASQGGRYTKHIYIGSQRIVSKLGDLQSYGADPRRIPYAGSETDNITVDYKTKYSKQQQVIKDNYTTFEVPYNGKDNNNYTDGSGFCCDDKPQTRSLTPGQNDNYERAQFYYHPDHLGSSSFITNLDGDVTQHIEYVPFGEVFIEERNNVWNTPYLFNGKELDEETGLYYYGARYYNPRISLWLSTDPLAEAQPDKTAYHFLSNNPINRIDPDGKWDIDVHSYNNRGKSGYAIFIVKDRKGNEIYRTVVKTIGTGGRTRNVQNSDTPQGTYKILGYRKTGEGTRYNRVSFGPNDLLALDYQGEEGGKRNGMHVHGGRQEGKYEGREDLASTHGCMRINDADILQLQNITTALEKNDPLEKGGFLNLTDDLKSPIMYSTSSSDRNNVGTDQFPKTSVKKKDFAPIFNFKPYIVPSDNTRVVIPYKLNNYE